MSNYFHIISAPRFSLEGFNVNGRHKNAATDCMYLSADIVYSTSCNYSLEFVYNRKIITIALSGVSKNRLTALLAKICGIEMRTRLEFLLSFVGNMANVFGC